MSTITSDEKAREYLKYIYENRGFTNFTDTETKVIVLIRKKVWKPFHREKILKCVGLCLYSEKDETDEEWDEVEERMHVYCKELVKYFE